MHFSPPPKGHPHSKTASCPLLQNRCSIRATLKRDVISHILHSGRNGHAQWPTTYQKQFSPQNPLNWNFNLGKRVHSRGHPLQNPTTLRRPTVVRPKADKDENQKRYVVLAASTPGLEIRASHATANGSTHTVPPTKTPAHMATFTVGEK